MTAKRKRPVGRPPTGTDPNWQMRWSTKERAAATRLAKARNVSPADHVRGRAVLAGPVVDALDALAQLEAAIDAREPDVVERWRHVRVAVSDAHDALETRLVALEKLLPAMTAKEEAAEVERLRKGFAKIVDPDPVGWSISLDGKAGAGEIAAALDRTNANHVKAAIVRDLLDGGAPSFDLTEAPCTSCGTTTGIHRISGDAAKPRRRKAKNEHVDERDDGFMSSHETSEE